MNAAMAPKGCYILDGILFILATNQIMNYFVPRTFKEKRKMNRFREPISVSAMRLKGQVQDVAAR